MHQAVSNARSVIGLPLKQFGTSALIIPDIFRWKNKGLLPNSPLIRNDHNFSRDGYYKVETLRNKIGIATMEFQAILRKTAFRAKRVNIDKKYETAVWLIPFPGQHLAGHDYRPRRLGRAGYSQTRLVTLPHPVASIGYVPWIRIAQA